MQPRERMLATLRRQPIDRIASYEEFYSLEAENKFAPEHAGLKSYGTLPATRKATPEQIVAMLRFMDCDIAEVASGRLRCRTIREDAREWVFAYESGAVWRLDKATGQTEVVSLPLEAKVDPRMVALPAPDDARRYEGVQEMAATLREQGYFTLAKVHGIFSGAWYLFRPLDRLFIDMVEDADYAHAIIDYLATFTYRTSEQILRRGVDCILLNDDMGSSTGLLFSPQTYTEFFQSWHRQLAELCHGYGAYLQIHSHGNINGIMTPLVDTGVDILNPIGPTDGMNLEQLLQQYSSRVVLAGGISKRIGEMSAEELQLHLQEVIGLGKRYGGYIFKSEGGIPPTMNRATFHYYMQTAAQLRAMAGETSPLTPRAAAGGSQGICTW